MENYIVLNGKKAELTPEQLKALGLEREIKTPFSRAKKGEKYYYIHPSGFIANTPECYTDGDKHYFNAGNYCTDKELLNQRAYMETLNRLLWRYSMEHKGNEIDWNEPSQYKYYIQYHYDEKLWRVRVVSAGVYFFGVFFYSREIAEAAIKEIIEPFLEEHPNFKPF